jgi:K+-sensing histidine kinase KdpD
MSESQRRPKPDLGAQVCVMAHDLKNPLAALVTNLHFVRSSLGDNGGADVAEALGDSVALCEVLERFTGNLDLLARRLVGRPAMVSLRDTTEDLVGRQTPHAAALGVRLDYERPSKVLVVEVDKELFGRAADNVLANAIEHAPQGSTVVVRLEREGAEHVAFVVRDEGPAMAVELYEQILKTGGLSGTRRRPDGRVGRGLGLVCAELAATAAGARLEVGGDARGSRLRLIAPLAATDEAR